MSDVPGSGEPGTAPLAQDVLFNPTEWSLWPAVAVLRWLLRTRQGLSRGLVYRSHPSLAFSPAEIRDVALATDGVQLTLSAPGLAAQGTILPMTDVARIAADLRAPGGGALAMWLDGPGDLFMQIVEASRVQNSASFALASGAKAQAHQIMADLAGATAPLAADAGGRLASGLSRLPEGALGLAAEFIPSTPSAAGLAESVGAYVGLPATVEEFAGAAVRVLRPARLGGPLMRILGQRQTLPSAGVNVVIDGGTRPAGAEIASQRSRRRAIHELCAAYIGSPSIRAHVFIELEPEVIEPARVGASELGGLAVLGKPASRRRLPLAA